MKNKTSRRHHCIWSFFLVLGLASGTVWAQGEKRKAGDFGPLEWPSLNEKQPSYTMPNTYEEASYRAPQHDEMLGPMQQVAVYEEEHHVYMVPFRYENVTVDFWSEYSDKGIELTAELGSITIIEKKPIVSVTVVGSGCSTPNYNVVEWWGEGEGLHNPHGQLIKRDRVDNLVGQHPAAIQSGFSKPQKFETLQQAQEAWETMQKRVYAMTGNYYRPGSLMGGLFENTAYFRIGDVNFIESQGYKNVRKTHQECYKVVVKGGSLDYEDPGTPRERHPADYAFRLIDVCVKK